MKEYKIDLSVLLIFFTRPDTLEKVFEKVKEARPSKLFLACDGPRDGNERDVLATEQCKKIVENIDWECEVYKRYSDVNLGCGKGPATAISWAFEHVDKLLILEDDCVADSSLFPFMAEMLDKYKGDERIGAISGFNHLKNFDCGGNSYCFTKTGATLGWGTWKRVWDKFDFNVKNIKNDYYLKLLPNQFKSSYIAKRRISAWEKASNETLIKKVNYWDIQFGFVKYSQSYLTIVPKNNLIYNIGVGVGSTHTEHTKKTSWKPGKILFMPTEALEFPLIHPKCVICDTYYDSKVLKILYPTKLKKLFYKVKRFFNR